MRFFIDKDDQAEVISIHSKDVDFAKLVEVKGNTTETWFKLRLGKLSTQWSMSIILNGCC